MKLTTGEFFANVTLVTLIFNVKNYYRVVNRSRGSNGFENSFSG